MPSYTELKIDPVMNSTDKFKRGDLTLSLSDKKFYLAFPLHLHKEAEANDEYFNPQSEDFIFEPNNSITLMGEKMGISNFEELIEKHRNEVAELFVKQENGYLFNRTKLGVYSIKIDYAKGKSENIGGKLHLFETDYFTHSVMRKVYEELKTMKHSISQLPSMSSVDKIRKYNMFLTSLGINLYVRAHDGIIFGQRSKNTAHSSSHHLYNSTVMEGISEVDADRNTETVDLIGAAKRGLLEELGIREHVIEEINIYDLFLEMNFFELGFTSLAKVDCDSKTYIDTLPAKDKNLEINKTKTIPFIEKELNKFVKNHQIYNQGFYNLQMVAIRHGIHVVYQNNTDVK